MTTAERELYRQWYVGLTTAHTAHQKAAVQNQRRHMLLGIPVILLSTTVGTAAFSTLQGDGNPGWLQFGLGLISIVAAALAGLQTFLNLGKLAEQHKTAAGRYGALRRHFEQQLSLDPEGVHRILDAIRAEWDELDATTPNISDALYRAAVDQARKQAVNLFASPHPESHAAPPAAPPMQSVPPASESPPGSD